MSNEVESQREELQQRFCASYSRLNWEMHKHSMERLEQIDLTMPQLIVLLKLHDMGGSATMCELIDLTLQSGPTLTRIVDRMVAAGMVRRERDDNDRRLVHIVLTDHGRAKRHEADARYQSDIACLTAQLDDGELQHLGGLLGRMLLEMETLRAHGIDKEPRA